MGKTLYKQRLPEEKVKQAQELVVGLTQFQWSLIKSAIDQAYSLKAGKTKFDSQEEINIIESVLKL